MNEAELQALINGRSKLNVFAFEEIIFYDKAANKISFTFAETSGIVIPRQGEVVEVRKIEPDTNEDRHMEGRVKLVKWYFSSSNNGPVVTIYLE